MDIYIAKGEERKGPYSEDSIRQFLADGQFDGTELAWHEGLTQWIAVEEVGREAESAAQEQADLDRQKEPEVAELAASTHSQARHSVAMEASVLE